MSEILLKSSDFNDFNHISWQNVWFTSQKWYHEIIYLKFIRFPNFVQDFSRFCLNLLISAILTIFFDIFFDITFVLLLKNYMMKLFSGKVSGFRFSPDFSRLSQNLHISVVLTIFLNGMFGLLLKNDIFSRNLSGFWIFPELSKNSSFFRCSNHFFGNFLYF